MEVTLEGQNFYEAAGFRRHRGRMRSGNSRESNTTPEELKRHLVEDGIRPAIFGSYNYDPVKQIFEPHKYDISKLNKTGLGSTKFQEFSVAEMGTTTVSTCSDAKLGGRHGNHTFFRDGHVTIEVTPETNIEKTTESVKKVTDLKSTEAKNRTKHHKNKTH